MACIDMHTYAPLLDACNTFNLLPLPPRVTPLQSDALKAEAVRAREEEERGNAMKALENRTKDSKREMDIMEALDEMRSLKARHAGITTEQALAALQQAGAALGDDTEDGVADGEAAAAGAMAADGNDELPEEDRMAMQQFLQQQKTVLRRLDSDESSDGEPDRAAAIATASATRPSNGEPSSTAAESNGAGLGSRSAAAANGKQPAIKVAVRAKRPAVVTAADGSKRAKPAAAAAAAPLPQQEQAAGSPQGGAAGILGLIGGYGSSSDTDEDT
eukprot:GHUV01057417.1.p1 GENE.GHUV01057417.1~~GHUV01057417.1.p1  ORF type:complete len:274 (+),score=141.80 GHUV01057417.1:61-882(+)